MNSNLGLEGSGQAWGWPLLWYMPRDDLALSDRSPVAPVGDLVTVFLTLTEEAQRGYLRLLQVGVMGMGWRPLVEMLTRLEEDERRRDLVTRLGSSRVLWL